MPSDSSQQIPVERTCWPWHKWGLVLIVYVCARTHALNRSGMSTSFAIPWSVAHQAPLSMKFSRREYCSGLPFPISLQEIFPTQGSSSCPLCLLPWWADSLTLSHLGSPVLIMKQWLIRRKRNRSGKNKKREGGGREKIKNKKMVWQS